MVIKELINNDMVLDDLSLYHLAMHKEKTPSNTNVGTSNDGLVYSESASDTGNYNDNSKPVSRYKVKQLIHSTQEDDQKILGITDKGSLRFQKVGEEQTDSNTLFDGAKRLFGITNDLREAGYILPDGTMLDFSGRHLLDNGKDDSFLRGRRTSDHREISSIEYEKDGWTETGLKTDMSDFIRRGAIRIDNNAGAINLATKPTKEQRDTRSLDAESDNVYMEDELKETKIVDKDGNPVVLYHSYDEDNYDSGLIYLSVDKDFSQEFGENTDAVYAVIKNPYVAEDDILRDADGNVMMFEGEPATIGYLDSMPDEYIDWLKENYDGVVGEDYEFVVAFDQDQIVKADENDMLPREAESRYELNPYALYGSYEESLAASKAAGYSKRQHDAMVERRRKDYAERGKKAKTLNHW